MVLIADKKEAERIKKQIIKSKERVYEIGEVVKGSGKVSII